MIIEELATYARSLRSWALILSLIAVVWLSSVVYSIFFHNFATVPGPFWAKVSRFWIAKKVLQGDFDVEQRELHRKYGKMTSNRYVSYCS